MEEVIPPSDDEERTSFQNDPNNVQEDFEIPSPPLYESSSEDERSTNSESENADESEYENGNAHVRNTDEDANPPNPMGLSEKDIITYSGDHEHEDDCELGWEWIFNRPDRGAEYGPFLGRNILLIDPRHRSPEDIFDYLFDNDMWTHLSKATNSYAAQKQTGKLISYRSSLYYIIIPG